MSRTVRQDVVGVDWRLWPAEVERADWAKVFGAPAGERLPLEVDVGFGGGEFLLELARSHPERAYVGIESGFDRVLKLTHKLARTPLRNVRLIGTAAEWAVRAAFAPASVESFWINFPDPWPKRSHARRRLVTPGFIHDLSGKLAPGGALRIATDDADYAATIHAVLAACRRLHNAQAPDPHRSERAGPRTAFERRWRGRGLRCFYFHYVRPSEPAPPASRVNR